MSTGLVYSPAYLTHRGLGSHPERPQRLAAVLARLQSSPLWQELVHMEPTPAPLELIHQLHDPLYVRHIRAASQSLDTTLDADTYVNEHTYAAALLAVGGVLQAVDAVMLGRSPAGAPLRNAFCAVRPPGHHALRDRAMGFCILGNVALAAHHLTQKHGLKRVAIVDFDVHHGNGTQQLLEERADVLFISLHQNPQTIFPGTGFAHQRGLGAGEGFTLNIPLEPGGGDLEYQNAFRTQVLPALEEYQPEFLLLSAGFDAALDDPLAQMRVSPDGFVWITRQMLEVARRHCNDRLVSVLEGGYDLSSLALNVHNHLRELSGYHSTTHGT